VGNCPTPLPRDRNRHNKAGRTHNKNHR